MNASGVHRVLAKIRCSARAVGPVWAWCDVPGVHSYLAFVKCLFIGMRVVLSEATEPHGDCKVSWA